MDRTLTFSSESIRTFVFYLKNSCIQNVFTMHHEEKKITGNCRTHTHKHDSKNTLEFFYQTSNTENVLLEWKAFIAKKRVSCWIRTWIVAWAHKNVKKKMRNNCYRNFHSNKIFHHTAFINRIEIRINLVHSTFSLLFLVYFKCTLRFQLNRERKKKICVRKKKIKGSNFYIKFICKIFCRVSKFKERILDSSSRCRSHRLMKNDGRSRISSLKVT